MQHARNLIQEILEVVYLNRTQAERAVWAQFERVKRETAPEIDELKARIEKLETMLVWAYSFTSNDMINYDNLEQTTRADGGRGPDPVGWGIGVIECRFDCDIPSYKDWSPW